MEQQNNEILDKVSAILSVQDKILEVQQEMKQDFKAMAKRQDQMEQTQKEMREELKKVGNTVTKIEYEHGRKIDLILDVLTGHTEKFEENERRYEKDQKVIEMYGHKIYALEQQKQK